MKISSSSESKSFFSDLFCLLFVSNVDIIMFNGVAVVENLLWESVFLFFHDILPTERQIGTLLFQVLDWHRQRY